VSRIDFVEFLRSFVHTMPASYRARYDATTVMHHAKVAYDRLRSTVAVGRLATPSIHVLPIVVAASDQPGLLSKISAAFVLEGWDVVEAEAYTRTVPSGGIREAIDLFWVRRPDQREKPNALSVARFRSVLLALLEGSIDLATLASRHPLSLAHVEDGSLTVRMLRSSRGTLEAVDVSADDRPGLLCSLTRALASLELQIVRCEARTRHGRVHDRFFVEELDGSLVAPDRISEIERELPQLLGRPTRLEVRTLLASGS
jgi:[protein-PII] uridylyltransferase